MDFTALLERNDLLPTLLFLLFFALVFSIIEMILVVILNHLEKHYWKEMIDVVIRAGVKHKWLFRILAIFIFMGTLAGILIMTPLLKIMNSEEATRLLAVGLPLVMMLILYINVERVVRLHVEKVLYGFIFLIISLVTYGTMLNLADESYNQYISKVNQELIQPGAYELRLNLEARETAALLKQFKADYLAGKCKTVNYTDEEKENILTQLVYIENDPELAYGRQISLDEIEAGIDLNGTECSEGENTFLLTETGNWYWVSEESIN